jgi:hypothetical protein
MREASLRWLVDKGRDATFWRPDCVADNAVRPVEPKLNSIEVKDNG